MAVVWEENVENNRSITEKEWNAPSWYDFNLTLLFILSTFIRLVFAHTDYRTALDSMPSHVFLRYPMSFSNYQLFSNNENC